MIYRSFTHPASFIRLTLLVMTMASIRSLIVLLFIILFSTNARAQVSSHDVRAPQTFEHDGTRFRAYVDAKTGTPSWVLDVDALDFTLGTRRSLASEASVAAAAHAFLAAHADVVGIHPDRLALDRLTTDGDLWFISFRQMHNGLPVLGSVAGITVSRSGKLVAVGVQAYPDLQVNTQPQLSASAARQVARMRAARPAAQASEQGELLIFPVEQPEHYEFKLVWRLRLDDLEGDEPYSTTFLVDAHTGEVLDETSNILHCSAHGFHVLPVSDPAQERTQLTTDRPPFVHLPDAAGKGILPATRQNTQEGVSRNPVPGASNSVYGTVTLNYYETPDNYNTALIRHTDEPFRYARVRIERNSDGWTDETYADANGYYSFSGLSSGSHDVTFEIANNRASVTSGLTTAERTHTYTVNVSGSVEQDHDWGWGSGGDGSVTSYALNGAYQVREMYDFFRNTYGYTGMDGVVNPLWIFSYDSGSTNGTRISLGGAEAMSSEVTLHEYTHDVIYRLYGNTFIRNSFDDPDRVSAEAWAMDEAFADYFSCVETGHGTFGGPINMADPNFPPPAAHPDNTGGVTVRWINNAWTMNDWNMWTSYHRRGQIISGAAWKVRQSIGSEADHLTFQALQITPHPASFESFRARMFAADDYYNSGANEAVIEEKFTDRFIGGPIEPILYSIPVDGDGFPTVTWNDNSSVEDGYRVERRFNAGSWSVVADLPAGSTSFEDGYRCVPGKSGKYYYRIQAYYENAGHPDEVSYSNTAWLDLATCQEGPFKVAQAPPRVGTLAPDEAVPGATELEAAYPNPFNPQTTIHYALAQGGPVRLVVYDVLGREVAVLVDEVQPAGTYDVAFDGTGLSNGTYLYRLTAGGQQHTHTMLLAK